jgi:hypothetical protein
MRLKLGMGLYIGPFTPLLQVLVSTCLVSLPFRGLDSIWERVIEVSERCINGGRYFGGVAAL